MDVPPPPPPPIPCSACNFLRRRCEAECIFAPYFPGDEPEKFAMVHSIYGASNVAKILSGINVAHREDAANSLAYEAEARLRDPVFGVIGFITVLHNARARARLNNGANHNNPIPQLPPGAILPQAADADQHPQLRPFHFENIPQQQMLDLNQFDNNNQLERAGDPGASSSSAAEAGGSSGAVAGGSNTNINLEQGEPAAAAPRHDAPLDYQLETQLQLKSPINDEDN